MPPYPARRWLVTARRRIHRPTPTAPLIGVALLYTLRLRGIALDCAALRAVEGIQPSADWRKSPVNTNVCQSIHINSQQFRKNPANPPRTARTADQHGQQSTMDVGQARSGSRSIASCDRFRNCVATRERARPQQTQDPPSCAPKAAKFSHCRKEYGEVATRQTSEYLQLVANRVATSTRILSVGRIVAVANTHT